LRSGRFSYLPLASIVVGILVLAVAVGTVSFRDIRRGRQQVADVLERQGVAVARFLFADLHASLLGPGWQRGRLELFFEQAGSRREVTYLALIDSSGRILAHSDRELVGTEWPAELMPEFAAPAEFGRPDAGPHGGQTVGGFVSSHGQRVYQFAAALELVPRELEERHLARPGRAFMRHMVETPNVEERMADLLGRAVAPDESVPLTVIVAFDASEIEAAFLVSRNHTLLMAVLLLVVGGTAIYFLFVLAGSRSAHTALRNMQSYTKNVIESMASGLVSLDADGRVVTVNPRAGELLGVRDSDVTGSRLSDIVALAPRGVSDAVEKVARGESDVFEAEAELVVAGERLPVSLSASSLRDEPEGRSGTVVLFRDLREVRELQEEVERARHLAAIGRLAAGVAHEVRNPLSSLKGFAQFLRGRFSPGSDEERYADIMIEEVERLDRVVQELLDFARPVQPERKPIAPGALLNEALALVSEDAGFHNVTIVRNEAPGLPSVLVDQFQIRQALLNVLLNAIEAMGDGGSLTIETVLSQETGGEPMVTVSVRDTGPGMSTEELDRLFEPFYTTKQKGTGLGLTIVSRLIEQNGGRISVESRPGHGSTFSLRLPVAGGSGAGPGKALGTEPPEVT